MRVYKINREHISGGLHRLSRGNKVKVVKRGSVEPLKMVSDENDPGIGKTLTYRGR